MPPPVRVLGPEALLYWLSRLLKLDSLTPLNIKDCQDGYLFLRLMALFYPDVADPGPFKADCTNDSNTYDLLSAALHRAGLQDNVPGLARLAEGDPQAAEELLLSLYQHYCKHHASKLFAGAKPSAPAATTGRRVVAVPSAKANILEVKTPDPSPIAEEASSPSPALTTPNDSPLPLQSSGGEGLFGGSSGHDCDRLKNSMQGFRVTASMHVQERPRTGASSTADDGAHLALSPSQASTARAAEELVRGSKSGFLVNQLDTGMEVSSACAHMMPEAEAIATGSYTQLDEDKASQASAMSRDDGDQSSDAVEHDARLDAPPAGGAARLMADARDGDAVRAAMLQRAQDVAHARGQSGPRAHPVSSSASAVAFTAAAVHSPREVRVTSSANVRSRWDGGDAHDQDDGGAMQHMRAGGFAYASQGEEQHSRRSAQLDDLRYNASSHVHQHDSTTHLFRGWGGEAPVIGSVQEGVHVDSAFHWSGKSEQADGMNANPSSRQAEDLESCAANDGHRWVPGVGQGGDPVRSSMYAGQAPWATHALRAQTHRESAPAWADSQDSREERLTAGRAPARARRDGSIVQESVHGMDSPRGSGARCYARTADAVAQDEHVRRSLHPNHLAHQSTASGQQNQPMRWSLQADVPSWVRTHQEVSVRRSARGGPASNQTSFRHPDDPLVPSLHSQHDSAPHFVDDPMHNGQAHPPSGSYARSGFVEPPRYDQAARASGRSVRDWEQPDEVRSSRNQTFMVHAMHGHHDLDYSLQGPSDVTYPGMADQQSTGNNVRLHQHPGYAHESAGHLQGPVLDSSGSVLHQHSMDMHHSLQHHTLSREEYVHQSMISPRVQMIPHPPGDGRTRTGSLQYWPRHPQDPRHAIPIQMSLRDANQLHNHPHSNFGTGEGDAGSMGFQDAPVHHERSVGSNDRQGRSSWVQDPHAQQVYPQQQQHQQQRQQHAPLSHSTPSHVTDPQTRQDRGDLGRSDTGLSRSSVYPNVPALHLEALALQSYEEPPQPSPRQVWGATHPVPTHDARSARAALSSASAESAAGVADILQSDEEGSFKFDHSWIKAHEPDSTAVLATSRSCGGRGPEQEPETGPAAVCMVRTPQQKQLPRKEAPEDGDAHMEAPSERDVRAVHLAMDAKRKQLEAQRAAEAANKQRERAEVAQQAFLQYMSHRREESAKHQDPTPSHPSAVTREESAQSLAASAQSHHANAPADPHPELSTYEFDQLPTTQEIDQTFRQETSPPPPPKAKPVSAPVAWTVSNETFQDAGSDISADDAYLSSSSQTFEPPDAHDEDLGGELDSSHADRGYAERCSSPTERDAVSADQDSPISEAGRGDEEDQVLAEISPTTPPPQPYAFEVDLSPAAPSVEKLRKQELQAKKQHQLDLKREKFLSNRAERRNLAPPHAPSHANKLDVRGSVARVVITSKAPSSPCSQDDAGSRSVPATAAGNCKVAPVETASLQHPSSDSPRGTVSPGDGETSRSPKSPAGGKPSSPGHGVVPVALNKGPPRRSQADGVTIAVASSKPLGCYHAPARMSNKPLIKNALVHRIMAGTVMEKQRNVVLLAMNNSTAQNFILLLSPSNKYKGLYQVVEDQVTKVCGAGPATLHSAEVLKFMKYDSGAKEFKVLQTKNFTAVTSGVVLHGPK